MFLLSRLPLTSTSNLKSAHYKYTYCCNTCIFWPLLSRHVNEYPTMHYFGNPRHTQSMIAYRTLSISGNSSEKLHCGNVVDMPYCIKCSLIMIQIHILQYC